MAVADPRTRAKARELAFSLLGNAFDQWRESFAEERRQGASEAEIVAAVNVIVAGIERQRGRIDDQVIDEMILMVKECAYATDGTSTEQ
jgi:hypothetical protein